jgi:hypothetical protein
VTRTTTAVGVTIDPFYEFEASDNNYDYLGKSWAGTSVTNVTSFFRLEAFTDSQNSVFRSVFSFVPATGTPGAPIMDQGSGDDAGDIGGDFAEHLEVTFLEESNDWNIRFRGVSVANGQTSIVALSPSIHIDNPNDPNSYAFTLDTESETMKLWRAQDDGDDAFEQTDLTALLLEVNFADAGQSWFSGDAIREHWFVGASDNLALVANTALDEDQNTNFSTCLWFPEGGADPNGAIGSTPAGSLDDEGSDTETVAPGFEDLSNSFGEVFGGIGAEGGAILLAIFWILVFAAGAYGILGGSPLAIGIGALCGFIFSIFTGLIPDILVFIVVLLAGAAVGMRLFTGGGGNGADM